MLLRLLTFAAVLVVGAHFARAEHLIVCGGPALREWENFRTKEDRHDRWWANFIRASTLRIDLIREEQGEAASFTWFVYKPGYITRGKEDGKPYIKWITQQATKRNTTLVWFNNTEDFIQKFNALPQRSIKQFDYFGHSNKHCFMFDYGNDIIAASTSVLHERDLPRLKKSVFARKAKCTSWGCHTAASMSKVWRRKLRTRLIGAHGKTLYTMVGRGTLPTSDSGWSH